MTEAATFVTGTQAGLSGNQQIRIALKAIANNDGSATIQQIYDAVESQLGANQQLSKQGKDSLRFFINKVAKKRGYVYPHNPDNPGWHITPEGYRFLSMSAEDQEKELEEPQQTTGNKDSRQTSLPTTLGSSLKPYVRLATHLNDPTYTPDEIVDRLGRIDPPIVPGLTEKPDAAHLVRDLLRLRLLEPLDAGRYRRWPHLADNTEPHLLRYAALTMLVPSGNGGYLLPILTAPLDGRPHPAAAWPLGETLPQWYAREQQWNRKWRYGNISQSRRCHDCLRHSLHPFRAIAVSFRALVWFLAARVDLLVSILQCQDRR